MEIQSRTYEKICWLMSLAGMAIYLFNRGWRAGHPLYVSKALAVLFLLCLAVHYAEGRYTRFSRNVIIGLAFGVAGDVYLLGTSVASHFLPGLISFLIGHVFYIVAFSDRKAPLNRKAAIAVAVAGAGALAVLVPSLMRRSPSLAVPVLIYAAVILVMVYFGVTRGVAVLAAGAILFAVSDSLLAFNRFVKAVSWLSPVIWLTYYAGQALITLSVKRQDELPPAKPVEKPVVKVDTGAVTPAEKPRSSSPHRPRSLRKPKALHSA
ncbi:MAG: lysoplasmalogenase [Spirochaetes bacterium]|nr:lysoplasmalogenase [Spirochaetota bacterium]